MDVNLLAFIFPDLHAPFGSISLTFSFCISFEENSYVITTCKQNYKPQESISFFQLSILSFREQLPVRIQNEGCMLSWQL